MLVLWFWSILWRLESRRCCTCLRCEFYPAELSVMHFLISIVLRRRLMMIVSALVSMGWVITGFYVSSSYSLSSCTSFSILYRIDNQTSWLVWSFALVPLLSIACDVSSEIFESHDLVNTFYCVLPVCSVLLLWRFPTSDWVFWTEMYALYFSAVDSNRCRSPCKLSSSEYYYRIYRTITDYFHFVPHVSFTSTFRLLDDLICDNVEQY